jgi:hypothetical protein
MALPYAGPIRSPHDALIVNTALGVFTPATLD